MLDLPPAWQKLSALSAILAAVLVPLAWALPVTRYQRL
jgi:hypothetical protein